MKILPTLVAATILPPVVVATVVSIGLLTAASAFAYVKGRHETADRKSLAANATAKSGSHQRQDVSPPDNVSLRTTLHLTSQQDRLWREAERADWQAHGAAQQPGGAASGENGGSGAGKQAESGDVSRQSWQAVYESLDAEQREKAASFFNDKLGESTDS
ncbi:hypothetical protein [Propionivibrio soli]|uniref:hypothetical protein n=1 Tax=Propionivibrio soli TaxID=2976531 RepID=UPI0021E8FF32|nr:hypothetical protein [Propionivibrio soli]